MLPAARCRLLALFGHGAMSELSPLAASKRTSAPRASHRKFWFLGLFLFGGRVLSAFNPSCPKLNLRVS
jgi:hypothetical protein